MQVNEESVGRYYDPATGQFLSVDPLVDETGQPYAYTGDNPVNESDPSGLYAPNACGQAGAQSAACGVVEQTQRQVAASEEANKVSGNAQIIDIAGAVGNFIATHKTDIEVGAGIVLGVAAAATGVGAVVEAGIAIGAEGASATAALSASAELGGVSLVTGAGATAIDASNCFNGHDAAACAGFGLGAVGLLASGAGEVGTIALINEWIAAGTIPAALLPGLGAFAALFGVAGWIFDSINGLSQLLEGQVCGS